MGAYPARRICCATWLVRPRASKNRIGTVPCHLTNQNVIPKEPARHVGRHWGVTCGSATSRSAGQRRRLGWLQPSETAKSDLGLTVPASHNMWALSRSRLRNFHAKLLVDAPQPDQARELRSRAGQDAILRRSRSCAACETTQTAKAKAWPRMATTIRGPEGDEYGHGIDISENVCVISKRRHI